MQIDTHIAGAIVTNDVVGEVSIQAHACSGKRTSQHTESLYLA